MVFHRSCVNFAPKQFLTNTHRLGPLDQAKDSASLELATYSVFLGQSSEQRMRAWWVWGGGGNPLLYIIYRCRQDGREAFLKVGLLIGQGSYQGRAPIRAGLLSGQGSYC